MQEEQTIKTTPLTTIDKKLQEKFAEDIANQSNLMDDLAKQLIGIELVIPTIYATVLKLLAGESATLQTDWLLGATFAFWLFALLFTLFAIFPEPYTVNSKQLDEIKDYFHTSAKNKAHYLIASIFFFFAGVVCSVWTII